MPRNGLLLALLLPAAAAVMATCNAAPARTAARQVPEQSLLVLSKGERALKVVDPATGTVLWQAPSGPDPHEVVASNDGTRAYISNYGGGGALNTITVIDLLGRKPLSVIDLGDLRGPHGVDYSGGRLWFTAEAARSIGSYDPRTGRVDWSFVTGQAGTHMILVSPDRIATSNVAGASISLIERSVRPNTLPAPSESEWTQTVLPAGNGVEGFDISPDGKELWAANARDGTITVIDLASRRVVQTLQANVRGANRLKFTPDGARVLVSSLSGSDVAVFDAKSRAEVKRIPVGRGAAGIVMAPDGTRAYVACTPDDYVAVIDLKSLMVTGHIEAGRQPDGLAWAIRR
jgi:YVTN family beta-propeller protein